MLFDFYQNLQLHLSPIAFRIGFFLVGWYSLMYLAGFLIVYLILRWRIKKDLLKINITIEKIESFIIYAIFGLIIGGRLGYVFFYEPGYFLVHPLQIISPINVNGDFVGIYGMSYHGGVLGILFSTWFFVRKNKLNFWKLTDFVIPAIPAGYFFGRIGNFLNGELYGRLTQSRWGMYFYNPMTLSWELRIPSQLLEAFFEGLVLFLILWFLRNKKWMEGKFLAVYLVSYSVFRFGIEFLREPDWQIGYVAKIGDIALTLGQVYSLIVILLVTILYSLKVYRSRQNDV